MTMNNTISGMLGIMDFLKQVLGTSGIVSMVVADLVHIILHGMKGLQVTGGAIGNVLNVESDELDLYKQMKRIKT